MLLHGCAASPPAPTGRPGPVSTGGVYVHEGSGLAFPATAAGFGRGFIRSFDAEGLDAGVGHSTVVAGTPLAVTVYVYPAPGPPGAPLTGPAQTGAARLEREHRLLTDSIELVGRQAVFEFDDVFAGRRQPLRSELFVFLPFQERWTVKYRFTYGRSLEASPHIAGLRHTDYRRR